MDIKQTAVWQTKHSGRVFLPVFIIFIAVSALVMLSTGLLARWKIDYIVLMTGNGILFLVTGLSFYLCSRALFHKNVQGFLRMIYSGMFLKMGVCIGSVLVWYFADPGSIGRAPLLGFFGLYFLYTFTEVALLMRLSKQKKNA